MTIHRLLLVALLSACLIPIARADFGEYREHAVSDRP